MGSRGANVVGFERAVVCGRPDSGMNCGRPDSGMKRRGERDREQSADEFTERVHRAGVSAQHRAARRRHTQDCHWFISRKELSF